MSDAIFHTGLAKSSQTASSSPDDVHSVIGPADFVSVFAGFITLAVWLMITVFNQSEDQYPFINYVQLLPLGLLTLFIGLMKVRAFEQKSGPRYINLCGILQCVFIWLSGMMVGSKIFIAIAD